MHTNECGENISIVTVKNLIALQCNWDYTQYFLNKSYINNIYRYLNAYDSKI